MWLVWLKIYKSSLNILKGEKALSRKVYSSTEFSCTMKSSSKHQGPIATFSLFLHLFLLFSNIYLFPSIQLIKHAKWTNVCRFILPTFNVRWKHCILYGYIEYNYFNWHIILRVCRWPYEHHFLHIHLLLLIGKSNVRARINWKHVLQLPMVSITNKTSTIIRLFHSTITENISFERLWNSRVFVKCFFIGMTFEIPKLKRLLMATFWQFS